MNDSRVPLPGSQITLRPGERAVEQRQPDSKLTVTIMVRHHSTAATERALLSGTYVAPSREAAAQAVAADPADISAVADFAKRSGLTVVDEDPGSRRVRVQGTTAQLDQAFGVHLTAAEDSAGHHFRTYEGPIYIPQALSGVVTAVLGLDERPIAKPH